MAITFTKVGQTKRGAFGDMTMVLGRLDMASYTSGGETINVDDIPGISLRIDAVAPFGASDTGYVFHWDETNDKMMAFSQDASGTSGTDTVGLAEADASDDAGEAWVMVIGR